MLLHHMKLGITEAFSNNYENKDHSTHEGNKATAVKIHTCKTLSFLKTGQTNFC